MCDYSLHHVATRPARIEDKLVVTKFHNSITRGFAAVGEPNVAVCLLPGTELAFGYLLLAAYFTGKIVNRFGLPRAETGLGFEQTDLVEKSLAAKHFVNAGDAA